MGEFPDGAETPPPLTRRQLLLLLGANAALAGAAGCSRGEPELIVPYVHQPAVVTPGIPTRYATTMTLGGYGTGLVVESHEGRPTKAEGNPLHPASLGALGTFEQASVLSMYDPARARELTCAGAPSTCGRAVLAEMRDVPAPATASGFTCSSSRRAVLTWNPLSSACVARVWSCTSTRLCRAARRGRGPSSPSGGSSELRAGISPAPTMSFSHWIPTSSRRRGRRWPGHGRGLAGGECAPRATR